MSNTKIWDKVAQPPAEALKLIPAGRLRGMTDISPQWRYRAATELFGPCGVGWKYEIEDLWLDEGPGGEIFANAKVNLFVKIDGEWTDPIPGIGGSMLVVKEKAGLHSNDEAYKMAVTDALSVAFKVLGFGADIYLNRWDGAKYVVPIEQDDGKVADWLAACEAAADDEDFSEWWTKNKAKIRKDCGDDGAAKVYERFRALK